MCWVATYLCVCKAPCGKNQNWKERSKGLPCVLCPQNVRHKPGGRRPRDGSDFNGVSFKK